jgi:transcriptional regulator with XRE-family HTH domain
MTPVRISPEALRDLRMDAGLLPGEVAKAVGISRSYYWRLETGRRYGKDYTIMALARLFKVPVSRITTRREPADVAA